ncbi:hypothetical protein BD769DRAFT_430496 [Suillus cothurnatus]|nr:hypothetical protein BD769DRAFT_430496 [Suillus cothurnatus]
MASWIDIFSFLLISSLFVGTILGVIFLAKSFSAAAQNTKESLQSRGISISDKGVSIKTSKRFDREDYVDATQRSDLLSADHDGAVHSTKIFGIRRTHSGASK